MIRSAEPADAPALCALYNHYIKTSIVTFEEEPVTVEDFRHRIETILEAYPWLVYEEAGTIAATSMPTLGRCATPIGFQPKRRSTWTRRSTAKGSGQRCTKS